MKREDRKIKNIKLIGALSLAALLTAFAASPPLLSAQGPDRTRAESLEQESVALALEGNLEKSIESIRESIKADTSYASAYIQLGNLLIRNGPLDDAFQAFDEALKINPGLHGAKTGKGIVLSRKGDLKKAETVLRDALALNPDPVRAHYELGLVYSRMGDTARALAEYKEGIKKFRQGRK